VVTCSSAPGIIGSGIGFGSTGTGAEGSFTAEGAARSGDSPAYITLADNSSGDDGTFIVNGGSAENAPGAAMTFFESTTAGNATITVNGGSGGGEGGTLFFNGQSHGGTASVALFGNGQLDIGRHGHRLLTVGSLEGEGLVFLGARALAVGSNNRSTAFSGIIQDGGISHGTGGSLSKIGTGTFVASSHISVASAAISARAASRIVSSFVVAGCVGCELDSPAGNTPVPFFAQSKCAMSLHALAGQH